MTDPLENFPHRPTNVNQRINNSTTLIPLLLLFMPLLASGCGQGQVSLGQVDGKVTMAGQPLSKVVVMFIPTGNGQGAPIRSAAEPDQEGRFRLRTESGAEGAVVGEHVVVIEDLARNEAPRSEDGTLLQPYVPRFPAAYSDPVRSPWKVRVNEGTQSIELEVKTP